MNLVARSRYYHCHWTVLLRFTWKWLIQNFIKFSQEPVSWSSIPNIQYNNRSTSLRWRHNEHDGVSNHRRLSGAVQRKYQGSASLAFLRGTTVDRWIPLIKDQQRGKCFHSSDDVTMVVGQLLTYFAGSDLRSAYEHLMVWSKRIWNLLMLYADIQSSVSPTVMFMIAFNSPSIEILSMHLDWSIRGRMLLCLCMQPGFRYEQWLRTPC